MAFFIPLHEGPAAILTFILSVLAGIFPVGEVVVLPVSLEGHQEAPRTRHISQFLAWKQNGCFICRLYHDPRVLAGTPKCMGFFF